jgi:hypothetical protein
MNRVVYTTLVVLLAPIWLPIMLIMAAWVIASNSLTLLDRTLGN